MTEKAILKAIEGTQFQTDLGKDLNFNGKPMPIGYYNLVVSIRDVALFCKGIRAHRMWRLTDVKRYFGVRGVKAKVLEQLRAYRDYISPKEENATA